MVFTLLLVVVNKAKALPPHNHILQALQPVTLQQRAVNQTAVANLDSHQLRVRAAIHLLHLVVASLPDLQLHQTRRKRQRHQRAVAALLVRQVPTLLAHKRRHLARIRLAQRHHVAEGARLCLDRLHGVAVHVPQPNGGDAVEHVVVQANALQLGQIYDDTDTAPLPHNSRLFVLMVSMFPANTLSQSATCCSDGKPVSKWNALHALRSATVVTHSNEPGAMSMRVSEGRSTRHHASLSPPCRTNFSL